VAEEEGEGTRVGHDCRGLSPGSSFPVGGRLQRFWQAWALDDIEPWVQQTLHLGYQIPFLCNPPPLALPIEFSSYDPGSPKGKALQDAIDSMKRKHAIEWVQKPGAGFYSRMFVVPKSTGGWRPIIDLSPFNKFVQNTKFKMETPRTVLESLLPRDWFIVLDLKDAYFQVPMHPTARKFLRFVWQGQVFQFRVLCFGLSTAPQVFTRVMAPISVLAHKQGFRLHRYLDDWLIAAPSRTEVLKARDWILRTCQSLGLLINMEKSALEPTQSIQYLGMQIDSVLSKVYPSEARIKRFSDLLQIFLKTEAPPAILWLRVLGHMVSLEKLVPRARLHMRSLQWKLKESWSPITGNKFLKVQPSAEVLIDLVWWLTEENLRVGIPLTSPTPEILMFSDASLQGWGAHLTELEVAGLWSPEEASQHINCLELKAVWLGLQHFREFLTDRVVVSMCDNTTVVSHIKNQGGTKSKQLCQQSLEMLHWAHQNHITLLAKYVPGSRNVRADQLSRHNQTLPAEWSLHPQVCKQIWKTWDTPWVDLFATKLNNQLQVYMSPIPDPQAYATDSLVQSWDRMVAYAYPPTGLIRKTLNKVRQSEHLQLILIAPNWPQQEWFVDLLTLVVDYPRKLPDWKKLLKQPHLNRFHQDPGTMNLHAWRLSSQLSDREAFQLQLPIEWPDQIESLHSNSTNPSGQFTAIGAVKGRSLHSKPLFL